MYILFHYRVMKKQQKEMNLYGIALPLEEEEKGKENSGSFTVEWPYVLPFHAWKDPEIALVSLTFTNSYFNLNTKSEIYIKEEDEKEWKGYFLNPGFYSSYDILVQSLNRAITSEALHFQYDSERGEIKVTTKWVYRLVGSIRSVLNLGSTEDEEEIFTGGERIFQVGTEDDFGLEEIFLEAPNLLTTTDSGSLISKPFNSQRPVLQSFLCQPSSPGRLIRRHFPLMFRKISSSLQPSQFTRFEFKNLRNQLIIFNSRKVLLHFLIRYNNPVV